MGTGGLKETGKGREKEGLREGDTQSCACVTKLVKVKRPHFTSVASNSHKFD